MLVFTSTIFKLALEITFLFNKYILLSKNRKLNKRAGPNKRAGMENFLKKNKRGEWGGRLLETRE